MISFSHLFLLIKFLFLGFIQGVTEPLPISSSGHVLITRHLLHIQMDGLLFEIIVNFGSLIAVFFIYYDDIKKMIYSCYQFFRSKHKKYRADVQYVFKLSLTTLITGGIGLLFESMIQERFSSIKTVSLMLLVTGIFIWMIKDFKGHKTEKKITYKDAIFIGLAQGLALFPGISRSGVTIVAAMFLGFKRKTALRYSFLLYIPVSIGVTLFSVEDIFYDLHLDVNMIPYIIAFLTAIITTFYSLKWFIHLMISGYLKYFSYYCFIIGIIIFWFI